MNGPILNADDAIEDVRSKAKGRTRYEGQAPFVDEMLVQRVDDQAAEIERLETQLAVMREALERIAHQRAEHSINCAIRDADPCDCGWPQIKEQCEQALAPDAGKGD